MVEERGDSPEELLEQLPTVKEVAQDIKDVVDPADQLPAPPDDLNGRPDELIEERVQEIVDNNLDNLYDALGEEFDITHGDVPPPLAFQLEEAVNDMNDALQKMVKAWIRANKK